MRFLAFIKIDTTRTASWPFATCLTLLFHQNTRDRLSGRGMDDHMVGAWCKMIPA
jgi:hypothetical protein